MADDPRDSQPPKKPPPGVIAQLAPPEPPVSWELERTPVEATQHVSQAALVQGTDIRVRQLKNALVDFMEYTQSHIDSLRAEMREDRKQASDNIQYVGRRQDIITDKFQALTIVLGDLRASDVRQESQNASILLKMDEARIREEQKLADERLTREQRAAQEQLEREQAAAKELLAREQSGARKLAELDLNKHQKLKALEVDTNEKLILMKDASEDRAVKRRWIDAAGNKVIVAVGGLLTLAIAWLAGRC